MFDDLFTVLFDRLPRPLRIGCWVLFGLLMMAGVVLWLMGEI